MMRDSLRQKQVLEILPEMRLKKAANPRKLFPPGTVWYTNVKMVATAQHTIPIITSIWNSIYVNAKK
jgi:hypothetical protein